MSPTLAVYDPAHFWCRNAELPAKGRLTDSGNVSTQNVINLSLGQLRSRMILPSEHSVGMQAGTVTSPNRGIAATFTSLVRHVICSGAREQMRWIAARRIVAGVQHIKTLRNRAERQHIDQPVSTPVLTLVEELTITPRASTSRPFPATLCLPNVRPEPIESASRAIGIATSLRAIALRQARRSLEALTTLRANTPHFWGESGTLALLAAKLELTALDVTKRTGERLAALLTGTEGSVRMTVHRNLQCSGAIPPAVTAVRGIACAHYSTFTQEADNG